METATHAERLRGLKVLLVEDEELVAMHVELMLVQAGCEVVAIADSERAALEAVGSKSLDAAILDVNIRGGQAFGVAEALGAKGIPYVFTSGAGEHFTPERFAGARHLQKPFDAQALWAALAALRR